MPQTIPALTVGEVTIHQRNGLFSLNDLHKASGTAKRHEPNRFLRLASTQELIAEMGASPEMGTPLQIINDGENNGTYACRELVIAYASWINAEFQLKVIRVFLDTQAPQRIPYSIQQGQTLTDEQTDTLRLMLQTAVEQLPKAKQVQAAIQGWAKLKAHFKVGYRHIPQEHYSEALNLMARHVAQLQTQAPQQPELAFDPTDAGQLQSARKAALDYFDKAREAIRTGGAWPTEENLEAILRGILANALQHCRFLVSFGEKQMQVNLVASNAFVANVQDLPRWIETGDILASNEELLQLGQACREKLIQKLTLPKPDSLK